ncbi:MAG: hypothetical protein SCARUB_01779 [Candidatus Scalindua rubra]|uniref:Chromosome partition protein Smc n=1 Tax=Candidatus Scalindua rubra TaxID=1872076 RepID=A0A1E3XBV3_9BACT|nr:MAG: hypothetical protein SCARUB_01779 [Candidatus Scalindua rubra]
MKRIVIILNLAIVLSIPSIAFAFETAPRITDREIVERLTRLEERLTKLGEGQKAILREIDKRFEGIDKRFEGIDKRFEGIDKRFEDMNRRFDAMSKAIDNRFEAMDNRFEDINKQFDRLVNIFFVILGAFVAMFGGTIWFALWDRRTMIRPFEDKVRDIEGEIAENRGKLHSLIDAFRTLSKTDDKVAEVLKKFNLL